MRSDINLQGINGYAQSGQLLAILGSSGSGKTSLLNVLAQRIYSGRITGDLTLDMGGIEVPISSAEQMKKVSGYFAFISNVIRYVMQDDYLFPSLTVKETLTYYANLRLPNEAPEVREKQVLRTSIKYMNA